MCRQTSHTFFLPGLNSLHEQWRRENGQRNCLATMAKDTDCPGRRDEMTFLWKQEQHNLNEFCWVERGTIPACCTNWSGKQRQVLNGTCEQGQAVNETVLKASCLLNGCTMKLHLKKPTVVLFFWLHCKIGLVFTKPKQSSHPEIIQN